MATTIDWTGADALVVLVGASKWGNVNYDKQRCISTGDSLLTFFRLMDRSSKLCPAAIESLDEASFE